MKKNRPVPWINIFHVLRHGVGVTAHIIASSHGLIFLGRHWSKIRRITNMTEEMNLSSQNRPSEPSEPSILRLFTRR